ncbi:hypothetical protein C8F01DRAFT_1294170 [Mycena amicta]|nr:hypothetical protein C8F01DRAFT_1294170 [Mycena amicta]
MCSTPCRTILNGSGQDKRVDSTNQPTTTAEWIRWGMDLERTQLTQYREMIHAYIKSHREHPLQNSWETICSLRDDLNNELDTFRTHQVVLFPSLTLSSLDPDSPEDATLQFPSQISRGRGAVPIDPTAIDHEIQLRCAQANSQILAVQDKTVTMSIIRSSRSLIIVVKRSKEQGEMLLDLEITIYNIAREALVHLGYMAADALKPFPPMKCSDTSRKDTHLFRMRGDSRVIGADSWRLLSGNSDATMLLEDISGHAGAPEASESESDPDELSPPAAGVQTRKRAGPSHRSPVKQRKTTSGAKSRVKVQKERTDGWIWSSDALMIPGETNKNVAAFKAESERVQFFRAEAEFFRWLEQYECKHIELFRVIERFRRDAEVWRKRAEQMASKKLKNPANQGAVIYARTQAAMWGRLRDRAAETFRSAESGANSHWVTATSFEGLVEKIAASRDELLSWMDDFRCQCVQVRGFHVKYTLVAIQTKCVTDAKVDVQESARAPTKQQPPHAQHLQATSVKNHHATQFSLAQVAVVACTSKYVHLQPTAAHRYPECLPRMPSGTASVKWTGRESSSCTVTAMRCHFVGWEGMQCGSRRAFEKRREEYGSVGEGAEKQRVGAKGMSESLVLAGLCVVCCDSDSGWERLDGGGMVWEERWLQTGWMGRARREKGRREKGRKRRGGGRKQATRQTLSANAIYPTIPVSYRDLLNARRNATGANERCTAVRQSYQR